jgi:hypothetical protein
MKQIHFYAAGDDLLMVLEAAERAGPLKYVEMGNFSSTECTVLSRGMEIPDLGTADAKSGITCRSFLVTDSLIDIDVRPISLVDGSRRYCIDQLCNPDAITFTPSGRFGRDLVLNGRLGTVSDSPIARILMKRFASAVRRNFTKVKAFWVGPNAMAVLDAGGRLTLSTQTPRDFDLMR